MIKSKLMKSNISSKIHLSHYVASTLIGLAIGSIILIAINLPSNWTFFLFMGLTIFLMASLTGKFKELFLVLLIVSIPINVDVNLLPSSEYNPDVYQLSLTLVDCILLVLLSLWTLSLITNKKENILFSPRTTTPILFLLAFCLLSMIKSSDLLLSLLSFIVLVKMAILYFYIANNIKTEKEIKLIISGLALAVLIQAVFSLGQKMLGSTLGLGLLGENLVFEAQKHLLDSSTTRISGTLGNPNILAMTFLDFSLPILLAMYFSNLSKGFRYLVLFAFIAGTLALIFSMSRGGYVALLVSISIILLANIHLGRTNIKRMFFIILILITLIPIFSHVIISRMKEHDYASLCIRVPLMKVALNMVKANPFLGVGISNYRNSRNIYDATRETAVFPEPVHNEYLFIASEIGIPGLMAFLWFVFSLYQLGFYCIRHGDTLISPVAIGILSGISGFLVHCLVDYRPLNQIIILWFLAGFIVALNKIARDKFKEIAPEIKIDRGDIIEKARELGGR